MRLTRFTDYSLRALVYLAQNSNSRVTIREISEVYDISKNHLMKVVSNLTRMGVVAAQRGPGGGIRLNVPAAEIRGYPELLADPQFAHRNVFIDFPNAADPHQTSRLIRAGYQAATDSPDTDLAPPLLGQHSREILLAAGYDDKQIDTWQAEGVI